MARQFDYIIVGGGSAGSCWQTASPRTRRRACSSWRPAAPTGGSTPSSTCRRLSRSDRQPILRLAVRIRARAVHARPSDLPRARQGPRRQQQHQRSDLPARQPARLRAVGGRPGYGDVVLRPLPALFQADGDRARRARTTRGAATTGRSSSSAGRRRTVFRAFFDAAQEAGYPRTDDVNGYRQEGFAAFDRNIHRGRRWSRHARTSIRSCAAAGTSPSGRGDS